MTRTNDYIMIFVPRATLGMVISRAAHNAIVKSCVKHGSVISSVSPNTTQEVPTALAE